MIGNNQAKEVGVKDEALEIAVPEFESDTAED
jgi:hypothetical protein